jgi:hypothetical protein
MSSSASVNPQETGMLDSAIAVHPLVRFSTHATVTHKAATAASAIAAGAAQVNRH